MPFRIVVADGKGKIYFQQAERDFMANPCRKFDRGYTRRKAIFTRLVEHMSDSLSFESTLGAGSRFTIHIPNICIHS